MRKILSIAICVMLLVGTVAFGYDGLAEIIRADATTITEYNTGDIIEFGSYPQTEETDDDIISELNSIAGDNANWTSYNYYSGTGEWDNGQMKASDYMRYKDLTYNGTKYRGVVFDSYRPYCTGKTSSSTRQDDNGYYIDTIYWFKYEPIEWKVLDQSTGLVMCATAIDSQAYNNYILYDNDTDKYYGDSSKTYYASDYAKSSIRKWLNDNFYNTAFSSSQQNIIKTTTLDNSSTYSTEYDSESTTDKIYLLSYNDLINSNYGFSSSSSTYDTARQLKSSDYAKCQGCYSEADSSYLGNCWWWLRSPNDSYNAHCVDLGCDDCYYGVDDTFYGVVPALNLNLTSDIIQSDASEISEPETNPQDDKEADNGTVEEDIVDKSDDDDYEKKDRDDKESDDDKETEDSGNVAIIIIAVFAVIIVALIIVIIIMATKKKKKPTVPTNPTYPNNQGYQNYPNNRNYPNNQGNPYYQQSPNNQNNPNNPNGPTNPPYNF